jgi:protein SCO1/2
MPRPQPGARPLPAVTVLSLAITLVLTACGRDYGSATGPSPDASDAPVVIDSANAGPFNGVELERPITKPDVVLQDTTGAPFNLASDTAGQVVLVYAGYTNCPDVCPTTVADLAAALRGLPAGDRERIRVVMFSTDPARDTPQRMRAFLDQFDASFTGVLGPTETLIGAINAMGIDVQAPVESADGKVTVEHGAQVLAFAPPSDRAGLLWTSGTSVQEYRDDLTALLQTLPQPTP